MKTKEEYRAGLLGLLVGLLLGLTVGVYEYTKLKNKNQLLIEKIGVLESFPIESP